VLPFAPVEGSRGGGSIGVRCRCRRGRGKSHRHLGRSRSSWRWLAGSLRLSRGDERLVLRIPLERDAVDTRALLRCFTRYMTEGGHAVTRGQFEANLHGKSEDVGFRDDIIPLLRPGIGWRFEDALRLVGNQIVQALPGDP